jgi:hypothetical protein
MRGISKTSFQSPTDNFVFFVKVIFKADQRGSDIREQRNAIEGFAGLETYQQIRIAMITDKPFPESPWLTIVGPERRVFTLILKNTGETPGRYRRIGRGEVRDGSDSAWEFRNLIII